MPKIYTIRSPRIAHVGPSYRRHSAPLNVYEPRGLDDVVFETPAPGGYTNLLRMSTRPRSRALHVDPT